MKTDHIPDIYIEQYVLGELPENLRREMDELIQKNPELNDRINGIRKSNSDILAAYPSGVMSKQILEKSMRIIPSPGLPSTADVKKPLREGVFTALTSTVKKFLYRLNSPGIRRYALSLSSAAAFVLLIILMFPGIRSSFDTKTDTDDSIRIKGLDSKLILYRMKGRNVEEIKNSGTAHKGDIIQVGYIATGAYKYGVILSIDGRGTVTLHYPDNASSGRALSMNKKILLNRSYELDDSPHFERFIMILSREPLNATEIIEKAKKLAISRENAINGSLKPGKDDAEFSIIIKKAE